MKSVMHDYAYGWRNGWRWVGWFVRNRRLLAALRQAFSTYVQGHIGETCERCGRRYLLWWSDDNGLYAHVTGYQTPDGDNAGGLYCPRCFDERARRLGLVLMWHPTILRDRSEPDRAVPDWTQPTQPTQEVNQAMKPPFGIGLIKGLVQSSMALFEPPPTEFYKQMARDYRTLPIPDFNAKYGNDWYEVHHEALVKAINYGS